MLIDEKIIETLALFFDENNDKEIQVLLLNKIMFITFFLYFPY